MKIIRNTLVLILSFTSLTYTNNNLQQRVGTVVLRVENTTNENYKITTSQELVFAEPVAGAGAHMIPAIATIHPIDSGIPVGQEKKFDVTLLSKNPDVPFTNFFGRKLYFVDESGVVQLEADISLTILQAGNSCDFQVILDHIPTDTQPDYAIIQNIDLTKGKTDFVVQVKLKGTHAQDSRVEVTAAQ